MPSVSAKFKVSRVTDMPWANPSGSVKEIELTPDYANGANADWATATPSGVMRMTVTNPAVFDILVEGQAVDIIITPA